jgi:cyclopropane-fatty-acyl-phospholipid synthase
MNPASIAPLTPPAATDAEQAAAGSGLWQRLVLASLRRFRHGALRMTLPGGGEIVLGDGSARLEAEMHVRGGGFFKRCALHGNVGFGEAYVEGEWDTPDIAAVVSWFVKNIARTPETKGSSGRVAFTNFLKLTDRIAHLLRPNSVRTSRRNIAEHYDLGNDFYRLWLDETMTYSSALFESPEQALADAQRAKYEALCGALEIGPGDHVLEIGCGWGGFCTHAAASHGCRVTAVTISREQFEFARERVRREGLEHLVEVRLEDYRHISGRYDKIASIEMLEAVGDAYLGTYFAKCHEVLKPDGLLGFQAITVPDCRHQTLRKGVDWIQKHIFPGSLLLSVARLNQAINRKGDLSMCGLRDMGLSYARTLGEWHDRFNERWAEVAALGFDNRFRRKWNYYLKYCEAAFATRNISVVQAVYQRPNRGLLGG